MIRGKYLDTSKNEGVVLIVDDMPNNMSLLYKVLSSKGFNLLFATDAQSCFDVMEYSKPDLILLDIMMPGIDGFQICQYLKKEPTTHDIPIIFMTALNDISSKVKGFEFGAVDYITKPFDTKEVLIRIKTHLNLIRLQKQLEQRSLELDSFAHTVTHYLKSPLKNFSNTLTYLENEYYAQKPTSIQTVQHLELANKTIEHTFEIINSLLMLAGVSRQQTVQLQTIDMTAIITNVQQRLASIIEQTQAHVILPKTWPKAVSYAPWIEEIWLHYLSNALKYGGTPPILQLGATQYTENTIQFWVQDNGISLSSERQQKLFTPLEQLKEHQEIGHGLGLSVVKQIAKQLKINIGVSHEQEKGNLFYFVLPTS